MVPTAIVPMLLYMSGRRAVMVSTAFILGIFVAYAAFGVVIVLGVDAILDPLLPKLQRIMEDPNTLEIAIQIVLGIILLVFGLKLADIRPKRQARRQPAQGGGPVSAFGFGAVFMLAGAWGAVPYFAAIDRILRADVSDTSGVMLLLYYNAIFVLPLIALVIARIVLGSRADAWFTRLGDFFSHWGRRVAVAVLILLGMLLVVDGIHWLTQQSSLLV